MIRQEMGAYELNRWREVVKSSSGDIRRMASVWRYSSIPICVPENVSDHSYWVMLYSVMIHKEVVSQLTTSEETEKYARNDVLLAILLKALIHDAPESVTGDIVRPFKYSSAELKNAIDQAEEKLSNQLLPKSVLDIMNSATDVSSKADFWYVESIVKAADFMSLYQFMRREVLRGNCEIDGFVKRMYEDLAEKYECAAPPGVHSILNVYYASLALEAKKLCLMATKAKGEIF